MAVLRYLGHAGFMLTTASGRFLFDPWIEGNPRSALGSPEELPHPDVVLVSHDHRDHGFEEAVAICRDRPAAFVGVFELVQAAQERGVEKAYPGNIGGHIRPAPDVDIYLTKAFHSSSRGVPCGFVVSTPEITVYHAGDTGYFSDMRVLGEIFRLDVAMLPVGSTYTMGPKEAAMAVESLGPRVAVPMHYGTFPQIEVDPREFAEEVARRSPGTRVLLMEPGESVEI